MNDRFNMYHDLEVHPDLRGKINAERRRMPLTPPHLQKGSCTWRLHDHSAKMIAYAAVRFNEIFSDDANKRLTYLDDGLMAAMIDLLSESVDTMRFTIDYVMGRSTTETAMGVPLNLFEITGLQRHVHGVDAAIWEYQMCGHLLWCESLIGKLAKLRSTQRHIALIQNFFNEDAMQDQRVVEHSMNDMSSDQMTIQKMREHFGG